MGIFNLFITIPQIFNAIIGGLILKHFFNGHAIYSLVLGGFCFIFAAISVILVDDKDETLNNF